MPSDRQDRADLVDLPIPGVRDVLEESDLRQHDRDHDDLEQEADPPRQVGGDEPAEQRPDRRGDRGRRTDQRVGLLLRGAFEVAVDERLHRGQQQRGAEAADDRPEDDDRGQALRERHRQRADRVRHEAQHVCALAADEVTDLAADQDERGGDQRLERDRRLDAADRRVEIVAPPRRSRRSSATCRRPARTSPSPAAARAAGSPRPRRRRRSRCHSWHRTVEPWADRAQPWGLRL